MPRYARQMDNFRCGPVAIANALKWAGAEFSYRRERPILEMLCVTHPKHGTGLYSFHRTLRIAGKGYLKSHCVEAIKFSDMEKHLRKGGAVILNYYQEVPGEEPGRHYELVTDFNSVDDTFGVANSMYRPTYRRVSRQEMKSLEFRYQQSSAERFVIAWFLTKKENL